jgi:hypothetical protein
MMKCRHPVLATVLALAVLTACGDKKSPTGPGTGTGAGTFTATVAGDVTLNMSGQALFWQETVGSATEWGLVLVPSLDNVTQIIELWREAGGRPGTGTFAIANMDEAGPSAIAGVFYAELGTDHAAFFGSTGGQLTISQSSTSRMQGSFSMTAEGFIATGSAVEEGAVTVTAQFDASSFLLP